MPLIRPRRLRRTPAIRALVRDTHLSMDNMIQPLFIKAGRNIKNEIASMPDQFQLSLDNLPEEIESIQKAGIHHVLLFGIPETKDATGSDALSPNGIIAKAISCIKEIDPNMQVIADCCFCEYTDHGHCGILKNNDVDNDKTLPLLARQAIVQAQAGADMIAPSAMMDGMVLEIREALDAHGFSQIPIMSYSTKFASAFYGPFREAAEGKPQFGDRHGYQMDFANRFQSLREATLDLEEGADILMIKPALPYLDIIAQTHEAFPEIPLAAYHVSGEYAMIKAASRAGWIDEKKVVLESLTAIKRAGANIIISYYAKQLAAWL